MAETPSRDQSSLTQVLLLCGSFFFFFMGTGAVQQFLVPVLVERTGVSRTQAAAIFSLVYFGGPLWLWLYAFYYRVLREKWCIVLAGVTYTLFALLIYFTHDWRLAVVAALMWSWGGETLWATGPAQVVNVADPRRRGSVSGLFQSATYSGQMIGVLLLGSIISRAADLRAGHDAMLLTAVGLSFVGNLLSLRLRVKSRETPPARLSDAVMALRRPAGRYLVLLSVANYLGWGLVLTTFTILVSRDLGEGARLHWIIMPYYVGRLVVAWLAGHTSDQIGRERVMLAGFVLGALSLVAVALVQSVPVVALASLVLGMQAAMVSVAGTAAVGDYIRPEERHLVFAGTNAWGYLTAGTTMIASPLLADLFGGFSLSFYVFAGIYGVAALIVARMRANLHRLEN